MLITTIRNGVYLNTTAGRFGKKLVLDGFQVGLSWITILKKRDAFCQAFDGFDPDIVAKYGEADIERLLQNKNIVRHRGKIEATISNARAWQKIETGEGFNKFLWNYVGGAPLQTNRKSMSQIPAQTELSTRIAKDLKKAGFKFAVRQLSIRSCRRLGW